MSSSTDTQPALQAALAEIAEIDRQVAELDDKSDELKKRRAQLEEIALEEIATQRLDGVKAAGRSWRVEWSHSFSAPEARKEAVMEAARRAGLLDKVTQVNTARLKALLTEKAKEAGTDPRRLFSDGTEFEGLVGEYVRPVLRHRAV
jgi:hypothetical protein